ncbi:uncharacterized protein MONBRDRAFT_37789 [Monosiga brevicollis MX1]|uniref:Uncharacterized protein n=1 Tax=Monosiga brevicollis TaxID=81824 RepID=A9V409_MONBE|nr:uncharacterized protein MONBRDRAFT_37789 [Monosiga brevicollis MX1]EDQ87900.1 predicted protein [Monosiga brevicollis MX1]|eukprot:XP_001747433.1 hypothetical protein [Monosiga brevicollis MX1]
MGRSGFGLAWLALVLLAQGTVAIMCGDRECRNCDTRLLEYELLGELTSCSASAQPRFATGATCNFDCSGTSVVMRTMVCHDGFWLWPQTNISANYMCPSYLAAGCHYDPMATDGVRFSCNRCGREIELTPLDTTPLIISADVQHLEITCHHLAALPMEPFRNMRFLETLNLSHNAISFTTKRFLDTTFRLTSMDLHDNKLSLLDWDDTPSIMPNFTFLDLSENNLQQVSWWAFRGTFSPSCSVDLPELRFSNASNGCHCALQPLYTTNGLGQPDCGRVVCTDACRNPAEIDPATETVSCTSYVPAARPGASRGLTTLPSMNMLCDGHTDCFNGFDEDICGIYMTDATSDTLLKALIARCHGSVLHLILLRGVVVLRPDPYEPFPNNTCLGNTRSTRDQLVLRITDNGAITAVDGEDSDVDYSFSVLNYTAARVSGVALGGNNISAIFEIVNGFPDWDAQASTADPKTEPSGNTSTAAPVALVQPSRSPVLVAVIVAVVGVLLLLVGAVTWRVRRQQRRRLSHEQQLRPLMDELTLELTQSESWVRSGEAASEPRANTASLLIPSYVRFATILPVAQPLVKPL